MPKTKNTAEKIPAAMEDQFQTLAALTDHFCKEHLNDAYAALARKALAALCRKRPSPVVRGRADVWACAVVYALGQVNFLSDKSQKPYMASEEVCRLFGVAPSTAAAKAKQVRDMLGMDHFDHRWMLADRLDEYSPVWLMSVNGFIVDIRNMPRPVQEDAFRRGLIPYIPADREAPHPHQEERDRLYKAYDGFRKINIEHQCAVAERVLQEGSAATIAKRIGIMDEDGAVYVDDDEADVFESLAPALDLALYTPSAEGGNAVQRYAREMQAMLTDREKQALDAMGQAQFSVFRIERKHDKAGVLLADTVRGDTIWLMDRGLEASGTPGMLIGMRVFKPGDFWMSTGVFVPVGSMTNGAAPSKPLETSGKERKRIDCDKLAEELYRGHFAEAA